MLKSIGQFLQILLGLIIIKYTLNYLHYRLLTTNLNFSNTILDSESCLALGGFLPFVDSQLFDLELITGISENIANSLLENKSLIINKTNQLTLNQRFKAFELAKGIGPKKSEILNQRFSLLEQDASSIFRCLLPENVQ